MNEWGQGEKLREHQHNKVTIALKIRINTAPETDDWRIRRLQRKALTGTEDDFLIDAAPKGAHRRGRGQNQDRQQCRRNPHCTFHPRGSISGQTDVLRTRGHGNPTVRTGGYIAPTICPRSPFAPDPIPHSPPPTHLHPPLARPLPQTSAPPNTKKRKKRHRQNATPSSATTTTPR